MALSFIYNIDYFFGNLLHKLELHAGGFFTPVFKLITMLGNFGLIFLLTGFIMLFFKKTRKIGYIAIISLICGVIITNLLLKNIVARPRPFMDESSPFYSWWVDASSVSESGYSFPSGHATAAMSFGVTLFIYLKKEYSWIFLAFGVIMGVTRMYFMVHYFTDVIAGFVVGIACSFLGILIFKFLRKIPLFNKIYDAKDILELINKK